MKNNMILMTVISAVLTACASHHPYGFNSYYGNGYNQGGNHYVKNNGGSHMNKALIGGGVGAVAGAALGTAFGGNDLANAGLGA